MGLTLRGTFTALVTPFKDGGIDREALRRLVDRQVDGGVEGLVAVGTTGESPTLSLAEHVEVVRLTVEAARGRVPVLAGTGANSTAEAVELSRAAKDVGAAGGLSVTPYYNRPTQTGLRRHYEAVFAAVDLPQLIYNIPGRTGVNMEPETMAALRASPRFAGVKEAAGQPDQVTRILAACGPDFPVLSGDDSLTLPFMAVGAAGVISTVSNLAPREMGDMVRAFATGRHADALALHRRLFPLIRAIFAETNPGPVKAAVGLLGLCDPAVRLPLALPEGPVLDRLKAAMREFGLKVAG